MRLAFQLIMTLVAVIVITTIGLYGYYIYVPVNPKPELSGTYTTHEIKSSGRMRSFSLYQPRSLKSGAPLLLVLHGSQSSGDRIRSSIVYEYDQYADEFGFLVAYPTGFENHWNDCRASASYSANLQDIDDIGFLRELVSQVGQLGISVTRVHAIGHSNGGHMAYRLALEAPDLVAGITAVSASLPIADNLGCSPSAQAVEVNIMNGTEDQINPYDGGVVELLGDASRGKVLSSVETAEYWAELAGAVGPTIRMLPERDGDRSTSVELSSWRGKEGISVKLYTLKGSGHVIPAHNDVFPRIIGPSAGDISAAEIVAQMLMVAEID